MRAAVFRGAHEIEVTDVPRPEIQPDEVLIRVAYCGICGSDLEAYHTGMYEPGMIIGHEFAGTIVQVGAGVSGWQIGERVTVNDAIPCNACAECCAGRLDACKSLLLPGITQEGACAEYTKTVARGLHRLSDAVTLRQGALVEPLAVALHGVRKSRLKPGDRVVVLGAGPIGLLTLQCALLAGVRSVVVTEVDTARAALARQLGATAVFDPTRDNVNVALAGMTERRGADIVFVCTGAPNAFGSAVSLVRHGGQIFVLGVCVEPVATDFMTVALNELCIEGSFAGRAEFPAAIDFIAQCRVNVDALVSHEIALENIVAQGFKRLETPESGAVKILVAINHDK